VRDGTLDLALADRVEVNNKKKSVGKGKNPTLFIPEFIKKNLFIVVC